MAEKRITFTVKKDGGGQFEVRTGEGFVGAQCENEVEAFVSALGARVTDGGDTDERTMERDANAIVERL
jgi:hypothetical protein